MGDERQHDERPGGRAFIDPTVRNRKRFVSLQSSFFYPQSPSLRRGLANHRCARREEAERKIKNNWERRKVREDRLNLSPAHTLPLLSFLHSCFVIFIRSSGRACRGLRCNSPCPLPR